MLFISCKKSFSFFSDRDFLKVLLQHNGTDYGTIQTTFVYIIGKWKYLGFDILSPKIACKLLII